MKSNTCDALLEMVCEGQTALDRSRKFTLVQIDFSVAFDYVNNPCLRFKLLDVGVSVALDHITVS